MKKRYLSIILGAFVSSCTFYDHSERMNSSNFEKVGCYEQVANVFTLNNNELIYQTHKGNIIKRDLESEKIEWEYQGPSRNPSIGYLIMDSLIWVNGWGGSPIVALNFQGNREFEIKDGVFGIFGYSHTFIGDTNGIIVTGVNGVSQVNPGKKKIDWKIKCFSASTKCNLFIAGADNSVIVGGLGDSLSFDYDNLLSIDKSSGRENWVYRIKGKVITKIAVSNKNVFVGIKAPSSEKIAFNDTNYLFCFDKQSGKLIWKKEYDFSHSANLLVKDGNLFFHSEEVLYSVSTDNGRLNWSKDLYPFVRILGSYKVSIVVKRGYGLDIVNQCNGETEQAVKAVIHAGPWFFENALCYYSYGCIFISQF